MGHLHHALPRLRPEWRVDVFGMDVSDAGQQTKGYMSNTLDHLTRHHPDVDWLQRLSLVTSESRWPFEDASFDVVTSNQVLEHVQDHNFVFGEIARCLRPSGISINLFPTREIWWEGHALMPGVHRIRSVERRERAMLMLARLGFRRHFYRDMDRRGWTSLEEFAYVFSRVLETDTNYLFASDLRRKAENAGLNLSFDYTKDFFAAKLLSLIGHRHYTYLHWPLIEELSAKVGQRLSSVTVTLRKSDLAL